MHWDCQKLVCREMSLHNDGEHLSHSDTSWYIVLESLLFSLCVGCVCVTRKPLVIMFLVWRCTLSTSSTAQRWDRPTSSTATTSTTLSGMTSPDSFLSITRLIPKPHQTHSQTSPDSFPNLTRLIPKPQSTALATQIKPPWVQFLMPETPVGSIPSNCQLFYVP